MSTTKTFNSENDYTLSEVKLMKWDAENGFTNGVRKYWLGEFNGDTNIAYNQVSISQITKSSYGFKEVKYKVEINADYYGECGTSVEFGNIGIKEVKKKVMQIIEENYLKCNWFLKKRNLQ